MFRLLNSHLQAYSLQVKSQDAVHTLGSQCVYISEIIKTDHLPRKLKRENCVTEWLKYYNIIIRIQALHDAFIQVPTSLFT